MSIGGGSMKTGWWRWHMIRARVSIWEGSFDLVSVVNYNERHQGQDCNTRPLKWVNFGPVPDK
jgi:hypothetical protein